MNTPDPPPITEPFLPFALPDVGDAEIAAVADAIRSGWLSSGPKVKEFETSFASMLGDGLEAVAVNSATAGLHLALEALGIGQGDEVIVPTWTFTATAEVVSYLGATPVLVDVDAETLNIDLDAAAAAVTSRTRAIMPVHFAGMGVNYQQLLAFASHHSIRVVEDAAHAFPAEVAAVPVGSADTDATVFSFYATKTITTGEGGMLVTRRPEIAARARVMRLHGISRDAFDRYRTNSASWAYEVVAPGYKYNMTDPAAAMGLVQLARARSMRDRRALIADTYKRSFADLPLALPPEAPEKDIHAWHLFVVRVEGEAARDRLIAGLQERGIGSSVHFIPLHLQPCWRELGRWAPKDFPNATEAFGQVVSLPIYSSMNDRDVERVATAVRDCLT